MKPLSSARIGYAGYSVDWSAPGDRRRFCAYAEMRGLSCEPAQLDRDYDLVIITHNADLTGWTARKRRDPDLKLVVELVDSYLTQTGLARRYLKGTGRRLLGIESRVGFDFLRTLHDACRAADSVICSTEEQRAAVCAFNPRVFTSFDWFLGDLDTPKKDYGPAERLRLAWEGQAVTASNLQQIREPLNGLRERVELHVITDPVIRRWFGRFGAYPTREVLEGIECPLVFRPWERASFSSHLKACDLAIIPIDLDDPMMQGKPENKLVMLWQLGIPALTSPSPAYSRTMAAAGIDMTCASADEWVQKLEGVLAMGETERRALGDRCREFALSTYSATEFAGRFDAAFEAASFSVGWPPISR